MVSIRIRIHGAEPMRIYEDPCSGQTLSSQKVEFLYFMKEIVHKTYLRWYKSIFKRLEIRFFIVVYFGKFSCSWIRIRIHSAKYGSRSRRVISAGIHADPDAQHWMKKKWFSVLFFYFLERPTSRGGSERR